MGLDLKLVKRAPKCTVLPDTTKPPWNFPGPDVLSSNSTLNGTASGNADTGGLIATLGPSDTIILNAIEGANDTLATSAPLILNPTHLSAPGYDDEANRDPGATS